MALCKENWIWILSQEISWAPVIESSGGRIFALLRLYLESSQSWKFMLVKSKPWNLCYYCKNLKGYMIASYCMLKLLSEGTLGRFMLTHFLLCSLWFENTYLEYPKEKKLENVILSLLFLFFFVLYWKYISNTISLLNFSLIKTGAESYWMEILYLPSESFIGGKWVIKRNTELHNQLTLTLMHLYMFQSLT